MKVGLTGNYMSGVESPYLSKIYSNIGIPIFDADLMVKFLLFNNSETIIKIRKQFGNHVFTNLQVDLCKFPPLEFKKLLRVIELDLIKAYERWRLQNINSAYTIFKSQILFEANWDKLMNYTICVFKPDSIRVSDISGIQQIRLTEAYNIIENEMDIFQKNNLSNYVLHDYNSYNESLEEQILTINKKLFIKNPTM